MMKKTYRKISFFIDMLLQADTIYDFSQYRINAHKGLG